MPIMWVSLFSSHMNSGGYETLGRVPSFSNGLNKFWHCSKCLGLSHSRKAWSTKARHIRHPVLTGSNRFFTGCWKTHMFFTNWWGIPLAAFQVQFCVAVNSSVIPHIVDFVGNKLWELFSLMLETVRLDTIGLLTLKTSWPNKCLVEWKIHE